MYAIIDASNTLYKIEDSSTTKDRMKSVLILLIIIMLLILKVELNKHQLV